MATLPLPEAILLEIHQSLGLPGYQTNKKTKFATGQDSLESHTKMGEELLHHIFDTLDMEPGARLDAIDNSMHFANAYKYLETHTWTYAADERQILWSLLGYFFVPVLARQIAFWSLEQALDKGMPGGRFWYLPEPREVEGKSSLYLPVAQVVDWLLDLLGMPLEEFADQRSEATDGRHDGLRRSLYEWRAGTLIGTAAIEKYFCDRTALKFKGTFDLPEECTHPERFARALDFVKCKRLTADNLRLEIPMTQAGRLEAILDGHAGVDEQALFVECIVDRYAAPSASTIRQRLRVARMMQDGYVRLLKFLGPDVDRQCTDSRQNKVLQLFAIYKVVYNLTVSAWRHCRDQGERAENSWFETHIPEWGKHGLFLSILPSRRESANDELARLLTRHFSRLQAGSALEDHIGLDDNSALHIIRRNVERMAASADELNSELQLVERMRRSSPWRALQAEHRYWVVLQVAQAQALTVRAREAAIQRLRDLAATPSETVQTILLDLGGYLNGDCADRPKDVRAKVQCLLDEALASEGYELWKAPILQYHAKHLLACNDLDGATKLFRQALTAARERNYGPLRGEVARDCLAVEVANRKLVANNHEKYYREMLAGGIITGSGVIPSLEDTARWTSDYFWAELYRPYPGITKVKRLADGVSKSIFEDVMPLLLAGDQAGLQDWIKDNRQLLRSSVPDVEQNSVLMMLIKIRTTCLAALPSMTEFAAIDAHMRARDLEQILEHWRQFFAQLAKESPHQLNITDLKGQTPLMLMAEAGDTELVTIMLQAGSDPELQDWRGMTALHAAIKSRVKSCVDVLLDLPCCLNKLTCDGRSPLHTASWSGNLHAVKRLLHLAPELAWQRDSRGATPLEMVESLIENPGALQCLVSERAKDGESCASKQELKAIKNLLEKAPLCKP